MFELKIEDLPELERLERIGMKWAARDLAHELWAYPGKPRKSTRHPMWVCGDENGALCRLNESNLERVQWSDPEPLNIAAAIAQIKAQKQIGCIFCRGHENDHEFYIDGNVLFYSEGQCGTEGIIISLCPKCGTPLPIPCEGWEKG